MATTSLSKQAEVVNKIIELKKQGIAQSDIAQVLRSMNLKVPSIPTIRKYYKMDDAPSATQLASVYQKEKAFDIPLCRGTIIKTLQANSNNKQFCISSLYDLLEEELVDTGKMEHLPGNQQTLRSYCNWLRATGQVQDAPTESRLYNFVDDPSPGQQAQLDYGVEKLNGGESLHFVCIRMRRSRLLFVRGQDHRFNATDTCSALHVFFSLMGGRVQELVIDQDACLVSSETLGEVVETQVFKSFLIEQDLKLHVCKKADPESKGSVENLVGFVKKNYLSGRLDKPLQVVVSGMPDWCWRKNNRYLNAATRRIPMEQFIAEEQGALRPNLPSVFGCTATLSGPVSVDKMRTITYKTNKYSVPPAFRFKSVYYRISGGKLYIYGDDTASKTIRQHDVAPMDVKHQLYMHPDDQRMPSDKWEQVKKTLLRRYPCPSMLHFLNGVCRENPRYREPQLSAILAFLDSSKPSVDFLEEVLRRCCETFSYSTTRIQAIYGGMHLEESKQQEFSFEQPCMHFATMPNGVTVQVRESDIYQDLFSRKVQETAKEAK